MSYCGSIRQAGRRFTAQDSEAAFFQSPTTSVSRECRRLLAVRYRRRRGRRRHVESQPVSAGATVIEAAHRFERLECVHEPVVEITAGYDYVECLVCPCAKCGRMIEFTSNGGQGAS
jgi:hypothetical protein